MSAAASTVVNTSGLTTTKPTMSDGSTPSDKTVNDAFATYSTPTTYNQAFTSAVYAQYEWRASNQTAYVIYDFTSNIVINAFGLKEVGNKSDIYYEQVGNPSNWVFAGSSDMSNWTTLASETGVDIDDYTAGTGCNKGGVWHYATLANKTGYRYYKFTMSSYSSQFCALQELEYYSLDYAVNADLFNTTGFIGDKPTMTNGGEAVDMTVGDSAAAYSNGDGAFDNDTTSADGRWLASAQTAYVTYDFKSNIVINALGVKEVAGASDVWYDQARNPASWKFYGSADGSAWTPLAYQLNISSDTYTAGSGNSIAAGVWHYAVIANTMPYRYYKLSATAYASDTSCVHEIELYALSGGYAPPEAEPGADGDASVNTNIVNFTRTLYCRESFPTGVYGTVSYGIANRTAIGSSDYSYGLGGNWICYDLENGNYVKYTSTGLGLPSGCANKASGGAPQISYSYAAGSVGYVFSRELVNPPSEDDGGIVFASCLMYMDGQAMSRLAGSTGANTNYYYGCGFTPVTSATNATMHMLPIDGLLFAFHKTSAGYKVVGRVNQVDTTIASATSNTTYFCIARINVNAASGSQELVQFGAWPVDEVPSGETYLAEATGELIGPAATLRYLSFGGFAGTYEGIFRCDEFRLADTFSRAAGYVAAPCSLTAEEE